MTNVFFGADYVSVTAEEPANWDVLKPNIFASIMDFYHSGQPLVMEGASLMPTVRRATTPSACAKLPAQELQRTQVTCGRSTHGY